MILINMPSRVTTLIEQYGIGKALSLLAEPDQKKLHKRMEKYRLVRGTAFKKTLVRISVNPIGRFGFIRSLFLLLFRPCQFYLK